MEAQLQQEAAPAADAVWARYRPDLDATEEALAQGITSDVALVGEVARYVLGSGGKRFRPLILAATARLAGLATPAGQADPRVAAFGCVVEYIHTATLLHDDVVDEGEIRRGRDAARTLWGNPGSVLVGDYLYARALALAVAQGDLEAVRVLTQAVEEMSEGEVFQLSMCGDTALTEAHYIRIVDLKTAALMSAAARVGGILGGADPDRIHALSDFGRNVGIAFQVADDALDYQGEPQVFGKALGGDLKDGKITLPLLYTLERCTTIERERLSDIVALDDEVPEDDLTFTLELMHHYGAIGDALTRAREFADRAKAALSPFAEGPDRRALTALADYVVERDH